MPHGIQGRLPVFAYGTLKQGFRHHAAYCRGAVEVRPAELWGRLFLWQPGIPILEVPDERILLTGTRALGADQTAADALGSDPERPLAMHRPRERGWRRIQGDWIVFPDPEERLKLLDAFEGVHPRTSEQAYERVLCTVRLHDTPDGLEPLQVAWCYVLPPFAEPPGDPIPADSWQPGMDD